MELPADLQKKIHEFFIGLPILHDAESQRAFLASAGIDQQFQAQLSFGKPPAQFIPLLLSLAKTYEQLHDERYTLEVLLETTKGYIGHEKRQYCESMIRELQAARSQAFILAQKGAPDQYASVKELLETSQAQDLKNLFPYSFTDFPQCLFHQGLFDVGVITGSSGRGTPHDMKPFREEEIAIDLFGRRVSASRDVANVPTTDMTSTSELTVFLGFQYSKTCHKSTIQYPDKITSICFNETAVPQQILKRNLILVGGADVNIYTFSATLAFQSKFGLLLPVRFRGDKIDGHFTCDRIFSELSRQSYSGKEDSGYMHTGYILMTANPWNPDKVMIIAVGIKTTGTAAALLALQRNQDAHATECEKQHQDCERWHSLSANNRYYPDIPGKVVLANVAHVIEGHDIFHPLQEEREFTTRRLPRRFIITDFEFLE